KSLRHFGTATITLLRNAEIELAHHRRPAKNVPLVGFGPAAIEYRALVLPRSRCKNENGRDPVSIRAIDLARPGCAASRRACHGRIADFRPADRCRTAGVRLLAHHARCTCT